MEPDAIPGMAGLRPTKHLKEQVKAGMLERQRPKNWRIAGEEKVILTSLLLGSYGVWNSSIRIIPHKLSHGTINTVTTNNNVALFNRSICKEYFHTICGLSNCGNTIADFDEIPTRQCLIQTVDKFLSLKEQKAVAVSAHFSASWSSQSLLREIYSTLQ